MKTFSEVERWCLGAIRQFGDPAIPVGHAFFRYVENLEDFRPGDELVFTTEGMDLKLLLAYGSPIEIPISEEGAQSDAEDLVAFGIEAVARNLWSLTPSLNLPGIIHVFMTLYDVPNPAPWKRLIVPATEIPHKGMKLVSGYGTPSTPAEARKSGIKDF